MLLDLPCILRFEDRRMSARTYDICYGGIGLLLPPDTPGFRHETLKSVEVPDLGEVAVDMRWRRMHRVGAAFPDEAAVKSQLAQFFRTIGRSPE
jgi:hypothetical protein